MFLFIVKWFFFFYVDRLLKFFIYVWFNLMLIFIGGFIVVIYIDIFCIFLMVIGLLIVMGFGNFVCYIIK